MKVRVIIENGDGEVWGRIEGYGDFFAVTCAPNVFKVLDNLRELIADYIKHEGKTDLVWKNAAADKIDFTIRYDLSELFEELNFLNISAIAQAASINESLMRQYARGLKFPSGTRLKLIQDVIHDLGSLMQKVEIAPIAQTVKEAN